MQIRLVSGEPTSEQKRAKAQVFAPTPIRELTVVLAYAQQKGGAK